MRWPPVRRWPAKLEDVDCLCCGRDAQQGGGGVERHTVYMGGHTTAAELVEFVGFGEGEDTYDGAFVGGCGKQCARIVYADAGQRRAVRHDNIYRLEFCGIKQEYIACRGRYVAAAWRGM